MKLTIERDALLAVLQRVATASAKRAQPILANVLFSAAKDGAITAFATDLEIEATATGTASVAKAGQVAAPATSLLDIAKASAQGSQINMELVEARLHVSAGRARWKLPTLPAADFPAAAPEAWEWSADVDAEILADMIGRVSWSASTETIKAFINGVHVSVKDGRLSLVATDGSNLALATMDADGPDHAGLTIPLRTCAEVMRFCADRDTVTLRMSYHKVGVEGGIEGQRASLTSKIISLPFAEYGRVMGAERGEQFVAGREDLTNALRRAMIGLDLAITGHAMKLNLSEGALSVTARSAYSEAADDIEAAYSGPETALGINGAAVLEMLNAVRGDSVTVRFAAGKSTPLIVEGGDGAVTCFSALNKV